MRSGRGCLFKEKLCVCVCVRDLVIGRWVMNLQVVLSPAHAHEHKKHSVAQRISVLKRIWVTKLRE